MLRDNFDGSDPKVCATPIWKTWAAKAAVATAAARERNNAHQPPIQTSDGATWSDLKKVMAGFGQPSKCAYCEEPIVGDYGTMDHYRPKGSVTVREGGSPKKKVEREPGVPHGGYWWLAFSWENLLLCCDRCNGAKSDLFPIVGERVADEPASGDPWALDDIESPLLLHPRRCDPDKHLRFSKLGVVAARDGSRRGQATIDICGLRRTDLEDERRKAIRNARNHLRMAYRETRSLVPVIKERTGSKAPYATAVAQYVFQLLETGNLRDEDPELDVPDTDIGVPHPLLGDARIM